MGKGNSKHGAGHMGACDLILAERIAGTRRGQQCRNQDRKGSGGTYELALRAAYQRTKKAAEIAAQHGPVRQIVKDGKPVQEGK